MNGLKGGFEKSGIVFYSSCTFSMKKKKEK